MKTKPTLTPEESKEFLQWWNDNFRCDGRSMWSKKVKEYLVKALAKRERGVVNNIKKWTKGKTVTKDKLREYLNTHLKD